MKKQIKNNPGRKSLNRQVKKRKSGIKIICPSPIKSQTLKDVRDENGRPVTLLDGSVKQEVVERILPFFKIGYTFDIKQTEGEPLPELCHNLEGCLSDRQKQIKDALLDPSEYSFGYSRNHPESHSRPGLLPYK